MMMIIGMMMMMKMIIVQKSCKEQFSATLIRSLICVFPIIFEHAKFPLIRVL